MAGLPRGIRHFRWGKGYLHPSAERSPPPFQLRLWVLGVRVWVWPAPFCKRGLAWARVLSPGRAQKGCPPPIQLRLWFGVRVWPAPFCKAVLASIGHEHNEIRPKADGLAPVSSTSLVGPFFVSASSSSLSLSNLELSDTKVYEPLTRALLGTAEHFRKAVVLECFAFGQSMRPLNPQTMNHKS